MSMPVGSKINTKLLPPSAEPQGESLGGMSHASGGGRNPLPALLRTALADPHTAIPLLLFGLFLLHAMAKLVGAAVLLAAVGVATKPDRASFSHFIKGWMKERFARSREEAKAAASAGGGGGGSAGGIVGSVASTLSGWLDKATATVISATHQPRFDDCTVALLARLHVSRAAAESAGLANAPLAPAQPSLPRGTRELWFLGCFRTWVLVPPPLVERMRGSGFVG